MIEINNLTTNPIDEEFLRKVAKKVLKEENKEGVDLSIALVGQGRIRELNKKYKRKNRVTDVLAFPDRGFGLQPTQGRGVSLRESAKLADHPPAFGGPLGEIVICLRETKKNAERFDSTFETELARVLIHGILHLLGENHENAEKQAKKMEVKENHYLKIIFNKI